jgi:polyisoprenoid-binding protein YceI
MKKVTLFALFVALTTAAFSQTTWGLDKAHAKMTFTVTHLAISEVDGVFKSFDAKITSSKPDFSDATFELWANLKEVSTNNGGRDGHLQKDDMFDTAKDSTMTFKSTSITKVSDKKFKLKGDLKLKGVTKSVELDLTLMGTAVNQRSKKNMVGFKATGSVKRTDFGVGTMPAMVVSEDVELRASGEFVQN